MLDIASSVFTTLSRKFLSHAYKIATSSGICFYLDFSAGVATKITVSDEQYIENMIQNICKGYLKFDRKSCR